MKTQRVRLLAAAALALGLAASSSAQALNFVLNDTGGAGVGTDVRNGFEQATAFWSHVLNNDVTVYLDIGYTPLGAGILGSTSSPRVGVFTSDVEHLLNLNPNKSALDFASLTGLPTLDAGGSLDVITNGYKNAAKQGVDTTKLVFDNDDSANNFGLAITRANAKALGFTGLPGGDDAADAEITFSSTFAFDFDPTNGIGDNSYDFLGVAIHEIGHALGFVSGVDTYDAFGGPNGPSRTSNTNLNNFVISSVLDLFRFKTDPTDIAPGVGPALDWSVGGTPYLSIDKGATMFSLGGNTGLFSTGQFNGDGRQASHWKDNAYAGGPTCSNETSAPRGIMDPTAGRCEDLGVTALDLAAFDVIGWNTNYDVLTHPTFYASTANAFNGAVPEPKTWMTLLLGFGMLGAAARVRRRITA